MDPSQRSIRGFLTTTNVSATNSIPTASSASSFTKKFRCFVKQCDFVGPTLRSVYVHRREKHAKQRKKSLRHHFAMKREEGNGFCSQPRRTLSKEAKVIDELLKDIPPIDMESFIQNKEEPSILYACAGLIMDNPPSNSEIEEYLHDMQMGKRPTPVLWYTGINRGLLPEGQVPDHHFNGENSSTMTTAVDISNATMYLLYTQVYEGGTAEENHNKAKEAESYLHMVGFSHQQYDPEIHFEGPQFILMNNRYEISNVIGLVEDGEMDVKDVGLGQYYAHRKHSSIFCFQKDCPLNGKHNRHGHLPFTLPMHPTCYYKQANKDELNVAKASASILPRKGRPKANVTKLSKITRPLADQDINEFVRKSSAMRGRKYLYYCRVSSCKDYNVRKQHNAAKKHFYNHHASLKQYMEGKKVASGLKAKTKAKQRDSGEIFSCTVPFCPFETDNNSDLRMHVTRIHGSGANDAKHLKEKFACAPKQTGEEIDSQELSFTQEAIEIQFFKESEEYLHIDIMGTKANARGYTVYVCITLGLDVPLEEAELREYLHENRNNSELEIGWNVGKVRGRHVDLPPHHYRSKTTNLGQALKDGQTGYVIYTQYFDDEDQKKNRKAAEALECYLLTLGMSQDSHQFLPNYQHFSGPTFYLLNSNAEPLKAAELMEEGVHLTQRDLALAQIQGGKVKSSLFCCDMNCTGGHNYNGTFRISLPMHPVEFRKQPAWTTAAAAFAADAELEEIA